MSHDEDPPELRDYVPGDDRPLRHPVTVKIMRVVIVLGVIGLVVPSLYATVALQAHTAALACTRAASASTIDADPVTRFELFGPAGPSWYCYARGFDGHEVLIESLGLIPG